VGIDSPPCVFGKDADSFAAVRQPGHPWLTARTVIVNLKGLFVNPVEG